ncbi:MAG TPA: BolA/IbaG family iron-sulfur metabolism protein [Gammaproteobacteria bacterium]|nr:BolA/IbaG family iron-sulfur metabolism protein [Gammaproteobacteria bacterium]
MDAETVKAKVQAELPEAQVVVQGEGDRFGVLVVAQEFEGMPKVKQHRKVYAALGEELKSQVHALEVKTFTPDQYRAMVEANNPS